MKKISLQILLVIATALSLSSCLEGVDPTGYLSDSRKNELAAEDPAKVFSATLAGMYTELQSACETNSNHNYFGQKSFDYLSSLMGNDMIMTGRYAMSIYHYLLDYRQQNYVPTANRWSEYYTHISNANSIIGSIDLETASNEAKSYYAQALGFRGYSYLYLTYLYQRSYYVGADDTIWGKGQKYDWSQAPCVPLLLEDTDGAQPRSTVAEVMDQLISDLTKAYDIFSSIGAVKTSSPTDFDGCVVANYLARAYMIKHDWDNALKYAQVVIDNYDILRTESDILQGFSSLTLPDVVFGCDITSDNSTIYMSYFSQMDFFGDGYAAIGVWRGGFVPTVDYMADDDIRLKWFVTDRSTDYLDLAYIDYQSTKFVGAGRNNINADGTSVGWELGDYIYLRSEEAYYMKAEILAHQNKLAEAKQLLESIMVTRQPSYSCPVSTKAELIAEINMQKRLEFWGEGIEYLDNRRLNIPVDRTDATWGAANNHLEAARFYYDQEDPVFLYQLPMKEIETNPMISENDQNE